MKKLSSNLDTVLVLAFAAGSLAFIQYKSKSSEESCGCKKCCEKECIKKNQNDNLFNFHSPLDRLIVSTYRPY